jgi:hypothetical protein
MKSSLSRLLQGFLLLSALSLLAALLVPWKSAVSTAAMPLLPGAKVPDPTPARASPEPVSPEIVLALFTKRNAPAPARLPPAPETPKAQEATWLAYLGFYTSAQGEPSFALKDTRSGRVITIGQRGASAGGWAVIAVEDMRIIVRKDSDVYIVHKR